MPYATTRYNYRTIPRHLPDWLKSVDHYPCAALPPRVGVVIGSRNFPTLKFGTIYAEKNFWFNDNRRACSCWWSDGKCLLQKQACRRTDSTFKLLKDQPQFSASFSFNRSDDREFIHDRQPSSSSSLVTIILRVHHHLNKATVSSLGPGYFKALSLEGDGPTLKTYVCLEELLFRIEADDATVTTPRRARKIIYFYLFTVSIVFPFFLFKYKAYSDWIFGGRSNNLYR